MKLLKKNKETICGSLIAIILFVIFPANRYVPEITSGGEQVWVEDMNFFLVKSVICLIAVVVLIFIGGLNYQLNKEIDEDE